MISHSRNAPKIREIISIKGRIQTVGKIAKAGNWMRSCIGKSRAHINAIPIDSWILEKATDGSSIYRAVSRGGDSLSFSSSIPTGGWRSETFINGIKEVVQVSETDSSILVDHSGLGISGTASLSKNLKRIVFKR